MRALAAAHATAARDGHIAEGAGVRQGFRGAVEADRLKVLSQARIHARGVLVKPLRQCLAHAVDDVGLAFFVMPDHGLHGLQNHGVLVAVAIAGGKSGRQHPAVFLREVGDGVCQKFPVQRQLVRLWCGEQGAKLLCELPVRLVHTGVASQQRIRPLVTCRVHGGGIDGSGCGGVHEVQK